MLFPWIETEERDIHDYLEQRRILVVGQGSIGQRHARLLRNAHHSVELVSASADGAHRSVGQAIAEAGPFDHVVVANVTSRHAATLQELKAAQFRGTVLVEKPLCGSGDECVAIRDACAAFADVKVGYNLRFHPVILALADALRGQKVVEMRIHVGQYLPSWRPGTDYKEGSSAMIDAGGGALRDLSHEIDLLLHLFGSWKSLVSFGGNLGRLGIQTDEGWSVILEMLSGAMATLTLNYFDQPAKREIVVTTQDATLHADLIGSTLSQNENVRHFPVERDTTYRALHEAMFTQSATLCDLDCAVETMRLIDAIQESAANRTWVSS